MVDFSYANYVEVVKLLFEKYCDDYRFKSTVNRKGDIKYYILMRFKSYWNTLEVDRSTWFRLQGREEN